jgi:hypothetical protein
MKKNKIALVIAIIGITAAGIFAFRPKPKFLNIWYSTSTVGSCIELTNTTCSSTETSEPCVASAVSYHSASPCTLANELPPQFLPTSK